MHCNYDQSIDWDITVVLIIRYFIETLLDTQNKFCLRGKGYSLTSQ